MTQTASGSNNTDKPKFKDATIFVTFFAQQHLRSLSGVSLILNVDHKVTMMCSCGRGVDISSKDAKAIYDFTNSTKSDLSKVKAIPASYAKVSSGSCIILTSNTNGHNYPLNTILVKLVGGYCLMNGNNDMGIMGNTVADAVFEVVSINKDCLDAAPKWMKKFMADLPIEEL